MNFKLFLLFLLGIFCIYNGVESFNYIVLFWVVTGITTTVSFVRNILFIRKDYKKVRDSFSEQE